MTLAQALSTYITLNFLLAVGLGALVLFSLLLKKWKKGLSAGNELQLHYFLLTLVCALTMTHPFLPKNEIFQPAAKIWSAGSLKAFAKEYSSADKGGYLGFSANSRESIDAQKITFIWSSIMILLLLFGGWKLIRDLRSLFSIRRHSFLLRRIKKCAVYLNDEISVPFSYYSFGRANVVIPTRLLEKRNDFKMAVAYELQHHRQGDTRWIYAIWFLRLVCILNPFVHLWGRWISEIQEFACDETLVDQNKVESQDYARCLVEVAETAIQQRGLPICATGLTFLTERNLLKRRIEKMFAHKPKPLGRSVRVAFGCAMISLMAATALASKNLVQDRRVSLEQAQSMAKIAQKDSDFPVVVNDLVLRQLNRYIGTSEGRDFMRKSLQRMQGYRAMIESKTGQYQLPTELLAIPIVESGYQNLPQDPSHKTWGAGIWMFIEPTARIWGLRVTDQVDERLNADLLTDAAMRYLRSNYSLFNNWELAILAYNVGERGLRNAMNATGDKDAWTLIRDGYENDRDYLPRVMATILIMKNPETIQ